MLTREIPMNKPFLLFSPVSDNDPYSDTKEYVSATDFIPHWHDGAALHIVREYHPKLAVLYYTPDYEKNMTALSQCIQQVSRHTQVSPQPARPQKDKRAIAQFEALDNEFRDIIENLHNQHRDKTILLNVTSGTPQMQAALYLLAATATYPVYAVQVHRPTYGDPRPPRPVNPAGFDLLVENTPNAPKRFEHVTCNNAVQKLVAQSIQNLCKNYDYSAALTLYNQYSELFDESLHQLLMIALAHITLDYSKFPGNNPSGYYESGSLLFMRGKPMKDQAKLQCYDYLLYMKTLLSRGDQSVLDYVRSLSPILAQLLYLDMEANGFQWAKICSDDSFGVPKIDPDKLMKYDAKFASYDFENGRTRLDHAYKSKNPNNKPLYELSANNLLKLIQRWGRPWVGDVFLDYQTLRRFEGSVRNRAAHVLTGMTRAQVRELSGGKDLDDIQRLLEKQFCRAFGVKVTWNALDRINRDIAQTLKL